MILKFTKYSVLLFLLLIQVLFVQNFYAQRSKSIASDDKVRNYVTDKTGTLNSAQIKSLESKLSAFEKETSNQLVVWMEPNITGGSLEDRSYELAEQNGIGQKDKNNGVLLYIAKNDRKLRIEVGYGLEGALTDALSSQIIRNEITPEFKKGNFYEGINAGVDAIIKATKGEYTADNKSGDDNPISGICCIPFPALIFFVIFIFVFVIPVLSRIFGRKKGKSSNWWWTSGSGGSGSNWSSGSSDSSWSSGSGFSGGGGSFGGGGSSGSW